MYVTVKPKLIDFRLFTVVVERIEWSYRSTRNFMRGVLDAMVIYSVSEAAELTLVGAIRSAIAGWTANWFEAGVGLMSRVARFILPRFN